MFMEGKGVERNAIEAAKWFRLGAEQGDAVDAEPARHGVNEGSWCA